MESESLMMNGLREIKKLCSENKVLLIFDEIFTGLGRTGVFTHAEDVKSDILCLGKALGGGLPLSACVATDEIMQAWPENRGEALHTGTFFGHPLSCRVGLSVLKEIVDQNLVQRSSGIGGKFSAALKEKFKRDPAVKKILCKGLMVGIQYAEPGRGVNQFELLRKKGFITLPSGPKGDVLSLTPALNVDEKYLEALVKAL